jgi:ubiquinol-cytochrome c reductase cytochrome c subunit
MTPSRHAARAGERSRVGALRGYVALLGVAVAFVVILGAVTSPPLPADAAEAGGAVREQGASLFLQNCASCHGPDGQGGPAGPTLVGSGAAGADFYLRTGRMPLGAPNQRPQRGDPHFSDEQIEALVEYVSSLGPGPAIPQVSQGGDLHRGFELYTANCAACHGSSGTGNAVGGGAAAADLHQANGLDIAEAMLVGPGVMPRFDFDQRDQDAIVAYVLYLQDPSSPGGLPLGGFGPVSEGFVAVVIGLTVFVAIARFVGRRPRGPQAEVPAEEIE